MRSRWLTSSAVFLILSILGIVIGGILRWGADDPDAANLIWALTTAIGIVPIGWEVLSGILHRHPGVDRGQHGAGGVLPEGGGLAHARLADEQARRGGDEQRREGRPDW